MLNIFQTLLNVIFPDFCCYCHTTGALLCSRCIDSIEWQLLPVHATAQRNALDSISVAVVMASPVRELIYAMKYQSVRAACSVAGQLLIMGKHPPTVDVLIPVPLHRKRQLERGYNQAEEMTKYATAVLHIPYANGLRRTHHTPPQASIGAKTDRLTRLNGSFQIASPQAAAAISNRRICLIDDVVTTGATLEACAAVLKAAGALEVHAFCLAHGQ